MLRANRLIIRRGRNDQTSQCSFAITGALFRYVSSTETTDIHSRIAPIGYRHTLKGRFAVIQDNPMSVL